MAVPTLGGERKIHVHAARGGVEIDGRRGVAREVQAHIATGGGNVPAVIASKFTSGAHIAAGGMDREISACVVEMHLAARAVRLRPLIQLVDGDVAAAGRGKKRPSGFVAGDVATAAAQACNAGDAIKNIASVANIYCKVRIVLLLAPVRMSASGGKLR